VTKNTASSYDNDLTVVVSRDVRTVTVASAANAVSSSASLTDNESSMPQSDLGEVSGQKPVSKVLDTAALAAALPRPSSTTCGSAFAGYNLSTTFAKSETGQY